jgi:cell division protein ZapE
MMPADAANNGAASPSALYQQGIAAQRWEDDPAQRAALVELDRVHAELLAAGAATAPWWRLGAEKREPVRGVYLWGAVGRGKTFLADLLFESLPFSVFTLPAPAPKRNGRAPRLTTGTPDPGKLRLHFHRFMGRVHAELAKLQGREDPLREVAAHFAAQARVLCLDEFFVTDIGDAMILAGLLQHLFERGTTLITTSNIEPAQLYRDGLQRARFLPAIALLEQHCAIVELRASQDYRLRELSRGGVYFTPLDAGAEAALATCFDHIACGSLRREAQIEVNGRGIPVKRRAAGVIWFDFAALCEGPRSVADYIELAQSFHTVLISAVPRFSPQMEDAARRFVNLVDEFYDRGVNLVLSAAAGITDLYAGERLRNEFARTQSRLIEMQSDDYLAGAHRQM